MIVRRHFADFERPTDADVGWYTVKSVGLALSFAYLCYLLGRR